ncbi:hypothetical protein BBJ28_00013777 [Nothophytophthora sp. Chile5]|nr:hypothetical protein BBJ28_00013777 [Nothophytophthora sp. Chile5]
METQQQRDAESRARMVAARLMAATCTPERRQQRDGEPKTKKMALLCLSPTDPSEDAAALAMASPVLTSKRSPVTSPNVAKMPLPGLQFAISSHRHAPSRELRLPSFSTAPFEMEVTPSVSSAEEDEEEDCEPKSVAEEAPVAEKATTQRRKKGTRRGTLHPEAKNVLKAWMFSPEHFAHPYPSEEEKEELASEAGIEVKQLSNWFTNARKRLWQPVLRQSGVEVKNFLSTGRGGPRGNKLDVPTNLQHLVAPSSVLSPPGSPSSTRSPLKRSWSNMQRSMAESSPSTASTTSSMSENAPLKRKKSSAAAKKRSKDARKTGGSSRTSNDRSHELLQVAHFHDLELLAATSLLGLHHQTQSVH